MALKSPVLVQPGTLGATVSPSVPGPASASPLTIRFLPAGGDWTTGVAAAVGMAVGDAAAPADAAPAGGVPQAASSSEASAPAAVTSGSREAFALRSEPIMPGRL